jgi:hypothetical protein
MSVQVICVGLPRTGTASLASALEILGYRTLHRAILEMGREFGDETISADTFRGVYDAWDAVMEARWWRPLLNAYPKAAVILTLRDVLPWFTSLREHMRAVPAHRVTFAQIAWYDLFGCGEPIRATCIERYKLHEIAVRAFCRDHSRSLLIFDSTRAGQWHRLCPFLGQPLPDAPYPWKNRLAW